MQIGAACFDRTKPINLRFDSACLRSMWKLKARGAFCQNEPNFCAAARVVCGGRNRSTGKRGSPIDQNTLDYPDRVLASRRQTNM
jgi:hypothetical protein